MEEGRYIRAWMELRESEGDKKVGRGEGEGGTEVKKTSRLYHRFIFTTNRKFYSVLWERNRISRRSVRIR